MAEAQKLYAHLYRRKASGTAGPRWEVSITASFNPFFDPICVEAVAGKRDARNVAARYQAICWNF